jgi:uncharacterized protein (DUF983 family)
VIPPIRWQPDRATKASPWPLPSFGVGIWRGVRCVCPICGKGRLFAGYLRVATECTACGYPLGLARADDFPPYLTIFLVAHIVVPLMLLTDRADTISVWTSAAIFLPLTLILTLGLLRPVKGGTVGLMCKLGLVQTAAESQ